MDRVVLVSLFVSADDQGLRLEVSSHGSKGRVRQQHYMRLSGPELLDVIAAELGHMRPGDLVDDTGSVQRPLWG